MSAVQRYRKKPVEVEAMQWTGTNETDIQAWTGRGGFHELDFEDRGDNPAATAGLYVAANSVWVTLEPGEWVLKDRRGFYPCQPDVFEETYEPCSA
jgi:hypothetical protein